MTLRFVSAVNGVRFKMEWIKLPVPRPEAFDAGIM
jgi:hypothetical protein